MAILSITVTLGTLIKVTVAIAGTGTGNYGSPSLSERSFVEVS